MSPSKNIFLLLIFISFVIILPACRKAGSNSITESVARETADSVVSPNPDIAYRMRHFWDELSFRDTLRSYDSDFMEQNFVNFIAISRYASKEDLKAGAEILVKRAEEDSVALSLLTRIIALYLHDPNSPMYSEEDYLLFLDPLIASPKTASWVRSRLEWDKESALKNRPGEKAADISFTTREGKSLRLYDLPDDSDILIVFYDPDCDQCREIMPLIINDKDIQKRVEGHKLKVLAIYAGDQKDLWKKGAGEFPEEWTVGIDDGSLEANDTYILRALPSLYLLDGKKKVILKDIMPEMLKQHFRNIRES